MTMTSVPEGGDVLIRLPLFTITLVCTETSSRGLLYNPEERKKPRRTMLLTTETCVNLLIAIGHQTRQDHIKPTMKPGSSRHYCSPRRRTPIKQHTTNTAFPLHTGQPPPITSPPPPPPNPTPTPSPPRPSTSSPSDTYLPNPPFPPLQQARRQFRASVWGPAERGHRDADRKRMS